MFDVTDRQKSIRAKTHEGISAKTENFSISLQTRLNKFRKSGQDSCEQALFDLTSCSSSNSH